MILRRLRLKDFRQYRGEHELAFAYGSERNVTLITGMNGAGKTSLFYALNWALYGEADELLGPLVSKRAAQEDPTPNAWVEVHFLHEGDQFAARRTLKVSPGGVESEQAFTLQQLEPGGRVIRVSNPQERVNGILPRDARRYFFFDGERIDELSKPGHEAEVREAVRSVLKLRILERSVEHLDDVAKEYQKALRQSGQLDAEQEELMRQADDLGERIAAGDGRLADLKHDIGSLEHQVAAARAKLDREADLKALQAEERGVEAQLDNLKAELASISEALREALAQAPAIVAGGAVTKARQLLDDKRARGEIPSGLRQQLIEDLVRDRTCICGRVLDDASTAALMERHRTSVSSTLAEAVSGASGEIRAIEARTEGTFGRIRDLVDRRWNASDGITDAERRLQDIESRRARDFTEDIAKLEESRRYLDSRLQDRRVEAGILERDLEALRRDLVKAQTRLQTFEAKSDDARRTQRRWELAVKSAEAARTLLMHFSADMRKEIEEATNAIFMRFVWKEKQFEAVRVTDEYELDVQDRFGTATLAGLSAGERQVLSLAFIAGMSKVTGEEAPLVIDTPFGRLSEMPVTSIVSELPHITKQLILFVTDREVDDEARTILTPKIGSEYVLSFDDQLGQTEITSR